jgi:flagellar FliJ protein
MAVFQFKLHTLHRLKAQLEDQAKNKFGIAVSAFNAELKKLNQINAAIAGVTDEFRRLSGGRFTAGKIKDFNYCLSALKESAERQETVVEEAMAEVNRKRAELIAAARQREMFDKLRDKAFARHMAEERRLEYRAADELVSYRGNTPAFAE